MDYAVVTRPKPGETVCGDRVLVEPVDGGLVCAVADGLGHGPAAGAAAQAACDYVAQNSDQPLEELFRGCDRALVGTRGTALTVIRICHGELWHAGVGNVETVARSKEPIRPICVPGIVGARFRKTFVSRFRVHPGDLLAVHTDGISSRLTLDEYRGRGARFIAEELLRLHSRNHDDATCCVLVV